MSNDATVRDTVLGLWKALSDRDWDRVKTFLSEDCVYLDVAVPALAARGPEDIVTRLKLGPGAVKTYVNHKGLLLIDGADAMYEHSETWGFHSGETAKLFFVSVQRVENGKITLWKDYWDMNSLTSQAPPSYLEGWAAVDTSWVFDATGFI
jgi:limonene-1,2-epoxide hydrolase